MPHSAAGRTVTQQKNGGVWWYATHFSCFAPLMFGKIILSNRGRYQHGKKKDIHIF